ncbi:UxaA family hydrolase [Demequina sp.]|uniref:UxaA family hydrolase n=1 Tax=Demequina sp. TaxID=2050685 RepID=UPI003A8B695E
MSPATATPHTLDLPQVTLILAPEDDVAVATRDLAGGTVLTGGPTGELTVGSNIARGHKVALRAIAAGEPVRKYGQVIGRAKVDIRPGAHVHAHNLGMDDSTREVEVGVDRRPTVPATEQRTFLGYRRSDGSWGTRNYIGIVTSVNCSASTARMIADQFRGPVLDAYPHVDGVVALTHDTGCGLVPTSEGAQITRRTLQGYASHPNMAGLLVLGLGCEMLPAATILDGLALREDLPVTTLTIQETGGIRSTVRAGVAAIEGMLPGVEALRREEAPASALVLGTNCGGSDGYSGITANPALGFASDLLIAQGGRSALAETPEVYGAEHLLLRRAVSQDVADALLARLRWWEEYAAHGGGTLDNNPSPGNKAGGLTTILEKSLGAVAKSGSSELVAVREYAQKIDLPGLTFMDTPGYDPVSVTGLVAGGATVVVFTTGRGSVLGCKPSPSIKVATNTETYERMTEDMDLNAGRIVDGTATLEEVGREIFEKILSVASGEQTVSEELDLGSDEFVPWQLGAVT